MTTDISLNFAPIDINSGIQGDFPIKTRKVTIAAGAVLPRFAVLGHETASDSYTLAAVAATDGSAIPAAILAEDVDATSGAIVADAYFTGEFGDRILTYGAGHTAATVDASFRTTGTDIFIRTLPVLG